jgi:hypothetical protein
MAGIEEGGQAPEDLPEDEEDAPIEVAGVPLVVWAVRLSIFLFIQGAIVLASYVYYGFGTEPAQFGPGFRLDPLHAAVNFFWGLLGSVIGFFAPRFAIDFLLAFALFFTALAGLGTFSEDHLGMRLGPWSNLFNWLVALFAWAVAIYAIWRACVDRDPPDLKAGPRA